MTFNDSGKTSQLTYSADTTFYGLTSTTANKVLEFDETAGIETIIAASGTLTFQGTSCSTGGITLRAIGDAADDWEIRVDATATVDIDYTTIKRSTATTTLVTANNSVDGLNNSNWTINACVNIAGTSNSSGGTVRVAVNGTLQAQTTTLAATWTISGVSVFSGNVITVYVESADDTAETTGVTKYDGTGNIAGMVLNTNVLSIGSEDTGVSLTVANLGLYDCIDSEDVMHNASTDAAILEVEGVGGACSNSYTDEKIDILSRDALTVGTTETLTTHDIAINGTLTSTTTAHYEISGSWDNNATFTAATSTVTFTATSGTETIDTGGTGAGKFFNNLVFGTSGAAEWDLSSALDVDGNLTIDYGTLDMNGANNINLAGNLAINANGNYTKGSGTFTFDSIAFATKTWSNAATIDDLGTVSFTGNANTLQLTSSVKATSFTITGSNGNFDFTGSYVFTLTGNGTPFSVSAGAFNPSTGTIEYAPSGTTGVTVASTTYHHIIFNKAGNTFSLTTSGITTNDGGDLTITAGTLDTVDTQNYPISVGGSWTNNGTFTARSGTVTFTSTSGSKTLSGTMTSPSNFYNLTFNGIGGGWSFGNNSATVANNFTITNGTVTAPGSTYTLLIGGNFTNNSAFTHNSGTVTFNDSSKTSQLTYSASTTFYALTSSTAGKILEFDETATVQTVVTNALTIQGTDCTTGRIFLRAIGDAADDWEVVVTGATLNIDYADIKRSTAVTTAATADNSTSGGNNTNWTINSGLCASGIDVAGTSNSSSGTVRVAVNGTVQAQTTTLAAAWTITGVSVNINDIVTVYVESVADTAETTGVTKYDGTGNISGMVLNTNVLSIGSDDTGVSLTVANLGLYDCIDSEDVMHNASTVSTTLEVEGVGGACSNSYNDEKIDILSGDTLTIGATETLDTHNVAINGTLTSGGASTYTVSGSWDNNSVFTTNTSTVTFTAASGTETIDSTGASTASFNNLTLGSGAGTATFQLIGTDLDVNGNLAVDYGTLDPDTNAKNITLAGNLAIGANGNFTKDAAATFTFDGSGTSTWSNTATVDDLGAVIIDGTTKIINTTSDVKATSLTVTDTLNISNDTLTITGTGTPLAITGTFTTTSSTVIYTGTTTATNITTTAYNNLTLTPSAATTYNLAGNLTGGNAMTGNLTINANATLDTRPSVTDYNITAVNVTINGTLDASSSASAINVSGDWDNNGTFTRGSSVVTFNASSGDKTINDGASAFYTIKFDSGATSWTYTDEGTSAATNSTELTINTTGNVNFINARTGTATVTNGTLNVDWYLGIHTVNRADSSDVNTGGCGDITISEKSGTPQSTVWRYNGGWGSAAALQTTGTGVACSGPSNGINPQIANAGAIRIREYSKTSSATTLYKYNLQVAWQSSYGQYDYYDDYGGEYLTSCLANTSACDDDGTTSDDTIGASWHRETPGTVNGAKPYDGVNNPPTQGSWIAGLLTGLSVTITGTSITFSNLNSSNSFTNTASTQTQITVTTSATNGYDITAWETQKMTHNSYGGVEIDNFNINGTYGDYTDPLAWTNNCSTAAPNNACGFGFTSDDTSVGGSNRYNTGTEYAGFPVGSSSPIIVADSSGPIVGNANNITYRISVSNAQRAGTYSTTVVYIVTAQY